MDVSSGDERMVYRYPEPRDPRPPSWSPAGTTIAFLEVMNFLGNQTRDQLDLHGDVEGQLRHANGTA
jgi:hypothetical protein